MLVNIGQSFYDLVSKAMALAHHQYIFSIQITVLYKLFCSQWMTIWNQHHKGLLIERLNHYIWFIKRQGNNNHIDLATAQTLA
jgi:uncharacterized membrane protein YagU involved in acid resistance